MDSILCIQSISVSCRPRMPCRTDLEAFREFLQHEETRDVALALQMIGHLDRRLDVSDVTWKEIFHILVFQDFAFVSVDELCRRFYDNGFQNLSKSLYIHFLHAESKSQTPVTIKRSVPANKKSIHIYFKNLKRLVHNAQFKNPRDFFRKQARLLQDRIGKESVSYKRQFLADKYIALLGAEIDAIAITYDTTLPDQAIFDELKSLTTKSTDASISEVVFYGRKANALAIAKKFSEGEDMVKQAHCCANFTGPCLEIANMIYIDVYFKLWQFERTPTSELKESLLYEGCKGLWALSEEEEDIRNLWKRMFLLRMIFCLLGLSNKGQCIPECIISKQDVERAEKYMLEIDLVDIEARREMMYFIAKARIKQLQGLFYDAGVEIDKASAIARSGNFKEIDSIEKYKSVLMELDPDTEAKPVVSGELGDLSEASTLSCSSLEQMQSLETLGVQGTFSLSSLQFPEVPNSLDVEETLVKQTSCNEDVQVCTQSPESLHSRSSLHSDISMETDNYSTWSVLGGQFQSDSSSGQSEMPEQYTSVSIEAVQETRKNSSPLRREHHFEVIHETSQVPYSLLEINDTPNLAESSSLFRHMEHHNHDADLNK